MCKIMCVAGIKKQHQDKVKKLCVEMIKVVSATDDDGFGYAAITREGKIHGEKWLNKEDAFVKHSNPKPDPGKELIKAALGDALKPTGVWTDEKVYDKFGLINQDSLSNTVAVIIHARRQTIGAKNIQNTHPFVELNAENVPHTAIIHNGSILNHEELTKKYSTCDSETILHEYLDNVMYYNPHGVVQLAESLQGQYAVGALTSVEYEDGTCIPILDIFKSNKELFVGYVKEIETLVFCTTEDALVKAVKNANMTVSSIAEVKDGFLMRFNAITGTRVDDPIPFTQSQQYRTWTQNTTTDHHRHSHRVNPPVRVVGPHNVYSSHYHNETTQNVKDNFQHNHEDLFNSIYYQPGQILNEKEKEYFDELKAGSDTNFKALRLVKRVMGL